jgi:phage replication-related protein YjqB (UPF0714/DUF867 family)
MGDKYRTFAQLSRNEREGIDFRVMRLLRRSHVAIIAPHGGKIEPGTSEIAAAIADDRHNLYCFEGTKLRSNFDLHIASANFDEPSCVELVARCDQVIGVHGLDGRRKVVEVGGLDAGLRDAICANLLGAEFAAKVVTIGRCAGTDQENICNRGARGSGVQLEISKGLRDGLTAHKEALGRFANAVRVALEQSQP